MYVPQTIAIGSKTRFVSIKFNVCILASMYRANKNMCAYVYWIKTYIKL